MKSDFLIVYLRRSIKIYINKWNLNVSLDK